MPDQILTDLIVAAGAEQMPSRDAGQHTLTRLQREIDSELAGRSAGRRESGRRGAFVFGRRRMLAAGATAAAALGVIGLIPSNHRGAVGPEPAAASVLERSAANAAQLRWQALEPGQFLYVHSVNRFYHTADPSTYVANPPQVQDHAWTAYDGTDYFDDDDGRGQTVQHDAFWWGLSYKQLISVAADPAELDALFDRVIHRAQGRKEVGSDADKTFQAATQLLALRHVLPPALGAAAYDALAKLPGIEDHGPVTDQLGRHGILIGRAQDPGQPRGAEDQAVIDPDTGELLETRDVNGSTDGGWPTSMRVPHGALLDQSTYAGQTIVDNHRDVPRVDSTP